MIAEEIGISAIRYNLIKQDLDKIITFDIVDSLSLEGNTGRGRRACPITRPLRRYDFDPRVAAAGDPDVPSEPHQSHGSPGRSAAPTVAAAVALLGLIATSCTSSTGRS